MVPWHGPEGQAAFHCQIAEADQGLADQIEPLYSDRTDHWYERITNMPINRADRHLQGASLRRLCHFR
jgi:hypothetical protein